MYSIGDLVIYSAHGVCKIEDISEKTIAGVTRKYYELHPLWNKTQLAISAPINNDEVTIYDLIDKKEADEVLESFKNPALEWPDNANARHNAYSKLINSSNRKDIASVVNTLMRKRIEVEQNYKKLSQRDQDLLTEAQDTLFEELAITLDTSLEQVNKAVEKMINKVDISVV